MKYPSEENKIIRGRHRDTTSLFGFWLEQSSNSDNNRLLVNPSAPNNDDNLVYLHMVRDFSMDEESAVVITPTQGGGKNIENRGGISYNINISGTTGYLPVLREVNRTYAKSSNGLPIVSDEEAETRSGYASFIRLRNLFRRYRQIKRDQPPEIANRTFLHFLDTKLSDYWVVEPTSFRLTEASRSPMTFAYAIVLRTIRTSLKIDDSRKMMPEDVEVDPRLIPQGLINVANAFKEGLEHTTGSIGDRIHEVNLEIRSNVRSFNNYVAQILGAALSPLDMLAGLLRLPAFLQREAFALPKSLLLRVDESLEALVSAIESTEDVLDKRKLNEFYLELRNLYESIAARASIITGLSPFESVMRESLKYSERQNVAEGEGGSLSTQPFINQSGLDATNVGNSFREAYINKADTIFSLAARELGDAQRFIEIVILNGLKHPWIIDDEGTKFNRQSGVLFPGDKVLIPIATASNGNQVDAEYVNTTEFADRVQGTLTAVSENTFTNDEEAWIPGQWIGYTAIINNQERVIISNTATTFTVNRAYGVTLPVAGHGYELKLDQFTAHKAVSPVEATYGRDILAVFEPGQSGLEDSVIVAFNGTGDFATITGIENYAQALQLLCHTEQGRNVFHPLHGIPLNIGSVIKSSRLEIFRFLFDRALNMDPRTDEVERIQISFESGTSKLEAEIRPVGSNASTVVVKASG